MTEKELKKHKKISLVNNIPRDFNFEAKTNIKDEKVQELLSKV